MRCTGQKKQLERTILIMTNRDSTQWTGKSSHTEKENLPSHLMNERSQNKTLAEQVMDEATSESDRSSEPQMDNKQKL